MSKIMRKKILFFILFVTSGIKAFTQEEISEQVNVSKNKIGIEIGAGVGLTKFLGDIEDVNETNVHILGNRKAYEGVIKANLSKSFDLGLGVIYGQLSGNENGNSSHRNFETDFLNVGLNLEYNFNGLYKKRIPVLTPFIGIGANFASYIDVRTDLMDADGNLYYYWDDGKIRNLPQEEQNIHIAEKIARDYEYETVLNEGPVNAFALPVYGGLDLHISRMLTFRLSSKYVFAFTDLVDNFDRSPVSRHQDGYFYNSISMYVSLTSKKDAEIMGDVPEVYLVDFKKLEKEDGDGDGVRDMADKCAGTPEGVEVDKKGCPVDKDNDGIADYLDQELETDKGLITDENGVKLNYEVIEKNMEDSAGIAHKHVVDGNAFLFSSEETGNYTVHVGTVNSTVPDSIKMKLESISGLNKIVVNDSLTIYTLGSYTDFIEASNKKQELLNQGMNEAFEVNENQATRVAKDFEGFISVDKKKEEETVFALTDMANGDKVGTAKLKNQNPDVVQYKVEVMSFQDWINQDQVAYVMAREGVEVRSAYTVKAKIYTIGSFDSENEAELLRKEILGLGVKDAYIVATLNNKRISVSKARDLEGKNKPKK